MLKRLKQDKDFYRIGMHLSEDNLDEWIRFGLELSSVKPIPYRRQTIGFYVGTAEGRLMIFMAVLAIGLGFLPVIAAGGFTTFDAVRMPMALGIIVSGFMAMAYRDFVSRMVLRFTNLALICMILGIPYLLQVDSPVKVIILWPALTALFVTMALTTGYLVARVRRGRRELRLR